MIVNESLPPSAPPKAAPHRISAASLHAARAILQLYDLVVKPDGNVKNLRADERCLAILIDITSNVYRAAQLRPELKYWQQRLAAGTATANDIAKFLRKIGVELEYLPNYQDREEEVKMVLPANGRF
jgi:hypothetical protein